MGHAIPHYEVDLFSRDSVRNARVVDDEVREFARRVSRIEIAGDPVPWMTTIGHGPARLPIHLYGD